MTTPLLDATGIVKRFGALLANDHVDLRVMPGEAHALLGENGAGKSTLVKMLYGLLQPEAGHIAWEGRAVHLREPRAARRLGIGMVFQHFSLFDNLTVAENVALALDAAEPVPRIAARLGELSRAYGLPLEPAREVWRLSVGERQRIEIVRCLMQDPRLLILDEPTSVLTPQEAEGLFATLDRIRAEGRAVLYISHKLEEVRRLCEAATILRHGRVVARTDPRAETAASLARMMVGGEVAALRHAAAPPEGPVRLSVRGLSVAPDDPHGVGLREVSLDLRKGEVLGIAGVAGNGQEALFAALSGEVLAPRAEQILLDGEAVGRADINARRRRGAAFVPEERLGHAAAPRLTLSDNALVSGHAASGMVRHGLLDRGRMLGWVDAVTRAFDVRKSPRDPEARALSGGNLQKFVVGREVLRKPGLLVVSQPTWGVDAGAASLIRQALLDLAREGSAVLVISQDLDELLEMADRIAVLFHGTLSPAEPVAGLTREAIGLRMGGAA
ncbi:MAG TPA: ABC transporter ATP-binding protein [Roseococcus sp.]|jgi:simple sugar transport system ATP-binding protein|nr:ABC transporter ATP-binding protein [Roseococcus sp.]